MNEKKFFVVPIDGLSSAENIVDKISDILSNPKEMVDYVSHIKFNDAFHLDKYGIRVVIDVIHEDYPDLNVFHDFKLADTNGTDVNVLKKYIEYMRPGDIVTVSSTCSKRAFEDIRSVLPAGVKIALVSVLTDTSKEECQMRRGMLPEMAILNDAINLLNMNPKMFDAVVCSPSELKLLNKNLPDHIEYIVPGIRDSWMDMGQQSKDRARGIQAAIEAGANFLVIGSQLSKGNPKEGLGPVESRLMSLSEVDKVMLPEIVRGDPLKTLVNLKGFYQAPKDEDGFKDDAILVAYSGTYESESGEKKNYVGDTYFNLAVIENHPQYLTYYAELMAEKLTDYCLDDEERIDALVGVPAGGVKIAQETGRILNVPGISLEKKVTALKTANQKEKSELFFRRNDGVLYPGKRVVLFEDLCNNFSTTEKAIEVVEKTGAKVIAIACVVNRSQTYINNWKNVPIIPGISVPSGQFKQEMMAVSDLIAKGNLSTDPKRDWAQLRLAMNTRK